MEERRALKAGVKRMKRETEKSILFQLKDYRENVKFQYVLKLVDVAAGVLYEALVERFQSYATDLSRIAGLLDETRSDKSQTMETLGAMATTADGIHAKLQNFRQTVETMRKPYNRETSDTGSSGASDHVSR